MTGSLILQMRLSVFCAVKGSSRAVDASGVICMSLALIGCHPRTDEPSKPIPLSNISSSRRATGTVVCCQMPGRSMNLKSTYLHALSLANWMTSFGFMRAGPFRRMGPLP